MFGTDPEYPSDPPVYKCGASIDYKILAGGKLKIDHPEMNGYILNDIINYNNLLYSCVAIF